MPYPLRPPAHPRHMQTLSVIVVSYNTRDLTRACLESVYRETALLDFEVIVVDNASEDGSADMVRAEFPQARLLALEENVGFAAANNRAAAEATGRYILLLNPDTVVLDGAIDTLVSFAEAHPEYGVYGGSTFFADGSVNPTSGWNLPTPWSLFATGVGLSSLFRNSRLANPESVRYRDGVPVEVGIVTGCLLVISRDFWERLGGFDTGFYMYGEDADLCIRARNKGARPVLCPNAQIIHYGGASETVRADKMSRLLAAKTRLLKKHWNPVGAAYGVTMLKLWAWSRWIALSAGAVLLPRLAAGRDLWHAVWNRRTEWSASSAVELLRITAR